MELLYRKYVASFGKSNFHMKTDRKVLLKIANEDSRNLKIAALRNQYS